MASICGELHLPRRDLHVHEDTAMSMRCDDAGRDVTMPAQSLGKYLFSCLANGVHSPPKRCMCNCLVRRAAIPCHDQRDYRFAIAEICAERPHSWRSSVCLESFWCLNIFDG